MPQFRETTVGMLTWFISLQIPALISHLFFYQMLLPDFFARRGASTMPPTCTAGRSQWFPWARKWWHLESRWEMIDQRGWKFSNCFSFIIFLALIADIFPPPNSPFLTWFCVRNIFSCVSDHWFLLFEHRNSANIQIFAQTNPGSIPPGAPDRIETHKRGFHLASFLV